MAIVGVKIRETTGQGTERLVHIALGRLDHLAPETFRWNPALVSRFDDRGMAGIIGLRLLEIQAQGTR